MSKDNVNTSKVDLSEEQIEQVKGALSKAGVKDTRIKKVRIPPRFEEISLKWVKDAPFFSEFMLRFNYYETKGIPTAGVNAIRGNLNLYYNPEFIDGGGERPKIGDDGKPVIIKDDKGEPKLDENGNIQLEMEPRLALTDQELEGLLIHEIYHLIRYHHERTLDDHYVFNIAADMLINDDILSLRIGRRSPQLPKGGVYLSMAKDEGYKGEEVTESLYHWLLDKREEYQQMMQDILQNQQGGGQGREGNQQSNGNSEGNQDGSDQSGGAGTGNDQSKASDLFDALYGSKIDVHEIHEVNDEMTQATIEETARAAKIRGWGNMSGNAISKIEDLLKPAQLPWQKILRNFLSAFVHSHGPHIESNWSRRNRRGHPLPGTRKLNNKIVVAVDTSGSISDIDLNAFFSEIEKIVKNQAEMMVIQCDTRINDVWKTYKKGDYKKIKVKGRGGTIVQPVFDYMIENKLSHYPVVYFTDGWFDYGFDTHGIKTIWCVTQPKEEIPHGKNVYIDVKA